jgi:hypothetical protein
MNPGAHHLTNVFFHILNTLFLFLIFRRMTRKILLSNLVALLFALHPLHVESVAWIAERKDVMHVFLHADDVQLCALRRASGDQSLFACGRVLQPWVNGKADAGNLAVCFADFGLLVFEAHSI